MKSGCIVIIVEKLEDENVVTLSKEKANAIETENMDFNTDIYVPGGNRVK